MFSLLEKFHNFTFHDRTSTVVGPDTHNTYNSNLIHIQIDGSVQLKLSHNKEERASNNNNIIKLNNKEIMN